MAFYMVVNHMFCFTEGTVKSSLLVHLVMVGVSPSNSILMCLYISEGKRIDIKGTAIRNPQDKI